ncbi:MAG: TolC family protein [Candidatus Sumerlaeaceae bacterium]
MRNASRKLSSNGITKVNTGRNTARKTGMGLILLALSYGGQHAAVGAAAAPRESVRETFSRPQVLSGSPKQVAQVIRKKSESATASATASTTTLPSLVTERSTVSVEMPAPVSVSSSTTDSESLRKLLLSMPPVGYDAMTTMPVATAPMDVYTSDIVDLDFLSSETQTAEYILPDTPLPQDELDRLTSSSKNAKRITLMAAICQALGANQNLRVEKLRPEISNFGIMSAESEFDTNLDAGVFYRVSKRSTLGPSSTDGTTTFSGSGEDTAVSRDVDANIGVSGRLPTGTNYRLGFDATRSSSNSTQPFYSSALNANITQNLLRGAGCDVNLIRVFTAKNDFVSSLYQLQQVLINLVTDVQNSYWDVFLALRTLQIQRTAYDVARQLRLRAEEFVRVGRAAPLEALSAQAEEASRISAVINAASDLKQRELEFLRLINPECLATGWRALVYPAEAPILPSERLVPEERVRLARYYRPDLRQGQIDLANGELEVVRTENGLLPQLDLVADYSLAGSSDRLSHAVGKVRDGDFPTYRVGVQFSYPLQNRAATAAYRRANFQRRLAEEAIRNFCQIIDVDVRSAIVEIERTRRLIDSTRVTEALRIRELEAESEKFRVGRSTQINVNQAQRDLVQAQLDTVRSEIANIKAYLELYRAEGTALQRRGIEPVRITPESGVP